jgi:c-di-GMP-binding flagellar brake protein YcgR
MAEERRRYRRIQAPVYCRPAGVSLLARHREAVDISLGGVRVYSDDAYRIGRLVKMEFFIDGGPAVTYTAQVVWIEELPADAPARYDVGLKFVDLSPAALEFLTGLLGPEDD